MDPLAHTLLGAALARTRLGRDRPLALPTLVLAANIADIDVVAYFWSSDTALAFRRGPTHGPIGLALLPLVVTWVVWTLGKRWRDRAGPDARVGFAPLLALSYLGAISHPALDWLNTYGVRFLYPFDKRWFYGDTLFIVDPWVWLVLGAGVVLSQPLVERRARRSNALFAVVATLTSGLLLTAADSMTARVLWFAGIAAILAMRVSKRPLTENARRFAATAAVVAFVLYVGAATAGARVARGLVREALADEPVERWMVGPLPLRPTRREVVVATPTDILYGRFHWDGEPRFQWTGWAKPRPTANPIVEAALADPSIRGFAGWVRFLWAEIDEHPDFWEVHLMDARYTLERDARFGSAVVRVSRDER
jgi:inner membrane protein